jgi:hypothetical protein
MACFVRAIEPRRDGDAPVGLALHLAGRRLRLRGCSRPHLLVVALPAAGSESAATTANLHWYLFVACFFALVHEPRGRVEQVATWTVIVAAALSEGIVLLLVPLALYRLWKAPGWGERALFVTFLVLAAAHFGVILTDDSQDLQTGPVIYEALPGLYGMRVIGGLLIGEKAVADVVTRFDLYPGYLSGAVTIAALGALAAYIWWGRRDIARRGLLVVTLAYSGLVFLAPTVGRGATEAIVPVAGTYVGNGSRYMVAPALLLATVLIALLTRPDPRVPTRAWSILQWAALGLATVVVVGNFRMTTGASHEFPWSEELGVTTRFCEQTGVEQADVRIPPEGAPWVVVVDCDELAP